MIFKVASRAGLDRISLLTSNYGTAFLLSAAVAFLGNRTLDVSVGFVALGVVSGVVFIGGFFMQALATAVAGMSLATSVMRLSVVIPFLASWGIWDEVPTGAQFVGLAFGGAAFFLVSRGRGPAAGAEPARDAAEGSSGRVFLVLTLLFIAGGAIDTMMKTFGEVYAAEYDNASFMALVFGVAFVTGASIIALRRRGRPEARAVIWGIVLGAVNFASVEFILRAIAELSGPFVFPANNIALVIGGALLGVSVWKEHLSGLNWLGIAFATVALVLLNF